MPVTQVALRAQELKHDPQCLELSNTFTQLPEHSCVPEGQLHCPPTHTALAEQELPQLPQWEALVDRSTHPAPHWVVPGGQAATQL